MSIYEDGGNHADRVKASTICNDDGSTEGRDPREMTIEEFAFLGHHARPNPRCHPSEMSRLLLRAEIRSRQVYRLWLPALALPDERKSAQGAPSNVARGEGGLPRPNGGSWEKLPKIAGEDRGAMPPRLGDSHDSRRRRKTRAARR